MLDDNHSMRYLLTMQEINNTNRGNEMKKVTIDTPAGKVEFTSVGNHWSIWKSDTEAAIDAAFGQARMMGARGNISNWIGANSEKFLTLGKIEKTTASKIWAEVE